MCGDDGSHELWIERWEVVEVELNGKILRCRE